MERIGLETARSEKADLGEIVVFTDDDVEPGVTGGRIAQACNRWRKHSVFGGRNKVIFPNNKVPKWGSDRTGGRSRSQSTIIQMRNANT